MTVSVGSSRSSFFVASFWACEESIVLEISSPTLLIKSIVNYKVVAYFMFVTQLELINLIEEVWLKSS